MTQFHGNTVFAFDFLFQIIGDGVPVFDRSHSGRNTGVVKNVLQEHRLPDAAMTYNSNIPFLSGVYCWHEHALQAGFCVSKPGRKS